MITLHITIASAIFSVMFAYRNFWQINELGYKRYPTTENMRNRMIEARQKWHKWQFALQIYIGVVIAFVSFVSDFSLLNSLGHGLLFGSTFWLVFDTLLGYLLTKNVLHVDSNGIGTVYKKIAWALLDIAHIAINQIIKLLNKIRKKQIEKEQYDYNVQQLNSVALAQYLLFISKVLFFALSVILSLI